MYIDLSLFHIGNIEHLCHTDCFVAFILLGLLYVPLKCAAWSFVADGSMRELEEGRDHWTRLDTKARQSTRKRSWCEQGLEVSDPFEAGNKVDSTYEGWKRNWQTRLGGEI